MKKDKTNRTKKRYIALLDSYQLCNGLLLDGGKIFIYESELLKIENKHFFTDTKEKFKTPFQYVKYICKNFTEIRSGNDANSYILCVRVGKSLNTAIIRFKYMPKEGFWVVVSAYKPTLDYVEKKNEKYIVEKINEILYYVKRPMFQRNPLNYFRILSKTSPSSITSN